MKALIVGAGNIGLGFLGYLLWKSETFSVKFLESRQDRVDVLNRERAYTVITVSNSGFEEEVVSPVSAIAIADRQSAIDAIVEADLILTAVGKANLAHIALCLAEGLVRRLKRRPKAEMHVIVIACENVYDNTKFLENLILNQIPEDQRSAVRDLVSFPCCMVDRIVPGTPKEIADKYPLAVSVEDFFQFVVDGTVLKAPFPNLPGVEISSNLEAKLEQKLFTLNMLHGIVGYWGHLAGYEFVHEAVNDSNINDLANGALKEVGEMLSSRHMTITHDEQRQYGEKILKRFQNQNLKDPIRRVALQPMRKLGGDERLVKPARLVFENSRVPAHLATGIAAAFHYKDSGDPESLELSNVIQQHGIDLTLQLVAGLPPEHQLSQLLRADYLLRAL